MTTLHDMFTKCGQSPWLDNLRRDWLADGTLADLIDKGIRGITSNPTIFAKAIEGSEAYDEQFRALVVDKGLAIEPAYWELAIADITKALSLLRPLYDSAASSGTGEGADGFVSLEVAPDLAHETNATIAAARTLYDRIAAPNLLVKVPGTAEGVPAFRKLTQDGISVNVTLIFSIDRYDAVVDGYISGLEERLGKGEKDLSDLHSVASFFVSRVDTEVDRRLEALGRLNLAGKAAVAQAKVAYAHFESAFSGPRWDALVAHGAHVQRPLWASTSTKNPAYPDLLYVNSLIGPHTVNTMPDPTVAAFLDHGTVARTIDVDVADAQAHLVALGDAGVDMADVAHTLENEGVASFAKSFEKLMTVLGTKAATFGAKGAGS